MSWVTNIDGALEQLTIQIEALKKKADDTIPSVQKIVQHKHCWDAMNISTINLFKHKNFTGWNTFTDFKTANEYQMKLLELMKSYEAAMVIHKASEHLNKDAIENNKMVEAKISFIMRSIGVPGTYSTSEYKTSRSRKPTTTTHQAGWLGDVRRFVPTSDNWSKIKGEMESKMREIEAFAKQKITELAAIEKKEAKELAEKALINYATTLKIKYNLSYELGAEEVLSALASLNTNDELLGHADFIKLRDLLDKVKEFQ